MMHPKKHRSHSARPRGQNSTPWGVETLVDPKEEPSKCENDQSVGSKKKKRGSNQGRCSTPPPRASKRIKNKSRQNTFQEIAAEFPGCVEPKNRGKHSVRRPRGSKPASSTSWAMSLSGFLNLGTAASKLLNARNVCSETRGTAVSSGDVLKEVAKVVEEEKDDSGVEQSNVAMVNSLAEVKDSVGEDANGTDEQTGATVVPEISLDVKDDDDGSHADANVAVERMGISMTGVAAELKASKSNGTDANSAGVPETDTLPDLKESNGSVADPLDKTDVQTNGDVDPLKDRAKDAVEFDSKTISGLNLDDGNSVSFDLSSAESALASLYGESDRDICIEFAVKLLMNETPLPKEAAEIEEIFSLQINGEKSAKRQKQEEPSSNSCSVWGNLQSYYWHPDASRL